MHNFIACVDKNRLNTNHHHSYKWPVFCVFSFFVYSFFFICASHIFKAQAFRLMCIPFSLILYSIYTLMTSIAEFNGLYLEFPANRLGYTILVWKNNRNNQSMENDVSVRDGCICVPEWSCMLIYIDVCTVHMHKHTHWP